MSLIIDLKLITVTWKKDFLVMYVSPVTERQGNDRILTGSCHAQLQVVTSSKRLD